MFCSKILKEINWHATLSLRINRSHILILKKRKKKKTIKHLAKEYLKPNDTVRPGSLGSKDSVPNASLLGADGHSMNWHDFSGMVDFISLHMPCLIQTLSAGVLTALRVMNRIFFGLRSYKGSSLASVNV